MPAPAPSTTAREVVVRPVRTLSGTFLVVALAAAGVVAPTVTLGAQAAPHPVAPHVRSVAVHGVDRAAARSRASYAAAASGDVPAALANRLDPAAAVPVTGDAAEAEPQPANPSQVVALDAPTTTAHFVAAGVTWDPGQDVDVTEVAMRVREGGTWTAWQSLAQTEDGVPTERPGTEPLLTNGADGVQVRVTTADGLRAPAGLRVDLVDPGTSAADGQAEAVPAASASAATGDTIRPKIVTRAQWGADESLGSAWPDVSSKLSAMYLHHTAGSSTYTKKQAAAQVRAIYAFHVKSRGWPDIGYQFLVDRFGTIYQGRRDAILDLPIGAQAGGYNTDTIGVSAMGNFQSAKPSAAMVASIEKVFAWQAYAHQLNVQGKTTLTTGTSTGSNTRAKAGAKVKVPVLLGHRDTNGTACPGKNLYAKLPAIRKAVAARVVAAVAKYGTPRPALAVPTVVTPAASAYPVQWASSATYSWKPVAGAVRYQVLTSSAALAETGPDLRSWTVHKTVTGTSASVSTAAGRTRAIAVRGIDAAGRRGPIAEIAQVSRAVAWSSVTRSSAWQTVTADGVTSYQATASATLKVKVAQARAVNVRVRGTEAGTLTVAAGSTPLGTLDIPASVTGAVRTVALTLPATTTGTLTLAHASGTADVVAIGFPRPRATDSSLRTVLPPSAPKITPISSTQAPVKLGTTLRVSWKAAAGATSYELLARTAAPGKGFTSTWKHVATTTATSATAPLKATGSSWQLGVRAVGPGGRSKIVGYAKTTRPVSNGSLVKSAGWTKVTVGAAYRDVEYRASKAGRTISVKKGKDVRHVALVVDAAPGRGRVAVYVGGKRVGTISTAATKHQVQRVVMLDLPSKRSGTVTLRTLDNKPVRISAVVLAR